MAHSRHQDDESTKEGKMPVMSETARTCRDRSNSSHTEDNSWQGL